MRRKGLIGFYLLMVFLFIGVVQVNAANTRSYGWGLPRHETGVRPDPGRLYESILAKHRALYIDKINDHYLYLTFDAGYENGYTEMILDVLKEENVPATFFLTGQYLEKNPDIVRRMVREHHIVGNHTYSHPDLTKLSEQAYAADLKKFEDKYYEITNLKPMKIMRPPRGIFSDRSLEIADRLGYYTIFWSLAYKDWDVNHQKGADYAYENVMKRMHPGAVILLHNVSEDNAHALKRIIVDLKKQGYQFRPITDLILAHELYV